MPNSTALIQTTDTFKLYGATLFSGHQQPWETAGYTPPPIPSMMCAQELRFLRYIAEHHYAGRGAIVDFGALMGSAAHALAAGIEAGGSPGLIFCYDIWRAWRSLDPSFTDGQPVPFGSDLLPYFLKNTAEHEDYIVIRKGSITEKRWRRGPIEIMLIDAAKAPAIMRHIANEFLPHLIVGGLLIQQDYVCAECPWLHIFMMQFADYFELMDSPEGGSVCWRLVRPFPAHSVREDYWRGPDAANRLLEARKILVGWRAWCVRLAEARHAVMTNDWKRAVIILEAAKLQPETEHLGYDVEFLERIVQANECGTPGFDEFD